MGPTFKIDQLTGRLRTMIRSIFGRRISFIISGAGLLFLLSHIWHAVSHPKPLLSFLTGVFIPSLFALLIVYLGWWAYTQRLSLRYLIRLIGWSFTGAIVMGMAAGMIVLHEYFAGRLLADAPYIIVNAATGGMIGGFVVGVYDTKNHRQTDRLLKINEAMQTAMHLQTKEAVCQHVVTVARDHLEMPITGIWLHDPEQDRLEPVAIAGEDRFPFDTPPVFTPGNSLSWEVFETGEGKLVTDFSHPATYNPGTELESELIVPLGRFGVLNIGSFGDREFDEFDVATAELLARSTTEALERTAREVRLRRQHDELDRRAAQLEGFTRAISHDLRNPLTVADGHVELFRETGEEIHLDRIQESHARMEEIIEDILWLADEGRQIGMTRDTSVASVATEAWRFVDTDEATLEIAEDCSVVADPDRLQQAFENIFRNATEHGGQSVGITVGCLPNGLYIEDDGPGIPPEHQQTIFEAGFTTSDDGTGFGLAIVDEIIRAHGWEVAVTTGSNGGARFEITGVEKISPRERKDPVL